MTDWRGNLGICDICQNIISYVLGGGANVWEKSKWATGKFRENNKNLLPEPLGGVEFSIRHFSATLCKNASNFLIVIVV